MSHSSFNFVSLEWLLYFGADFWWIYFFSSVNCLVLDYLGILVTNCKPWHQWPPCKINVLICYISDRLCIRFAYWICMFSEIWVTIILEVPCHTNFHQICWDCMFLYTCALTFFSILILCFFNIVSFFAEISPTTNSMGIYRIQLLTWLLLHTCA